MLCLPMVEAVMGMEGVVVVEELLCSGRTGSGGKGHCSPLEGVAHRVAAEGQGQCTLRFVIITLFNWPYSKLTQLHDQVMSSTI